MIRRLLTALAFVGALFPLAEAMSQPVPGGGGVNAPVGKSVQSVRQAGKPDFVGLAGASEAAAPQGWSVSNGEPADVAAWPATMMSQPSGCTSTFVGPRVIFTAAHCVDPGQSIMVSFAGKTRQAVCRHHPDYTTAFDGNPTPANWDKASADYAVCLVDAADAVNTNAGGVSFEVVGAGPDLVEMNTQVRLLGFGCNGKTTRSDGYGFLRTAGAKVVAIPKSALPNNYIVTDWTGGGLKGAKGGALCPGDSGGAAYWPFAGGVRRIVGINSRTGTIGDAAQTLNGTSYLSSTLTSSASSFLLNWANANGVGICGITANTQGCRE